ncbi:MAG: VCBS repeat-containing protein [Bryobacteraceae bacterium]
MRNNGNGTFDDVTARAGLLFFHPAQTASWSDYDNDGLLDLFIGVQSSVVPYFALPLYQQFSKPAGQPCRLYHNDGDGTFTEVAKQAGLALTGYVQGAVWGDYNNDGLPDLFLSRRYGPALLYRNNGKNPLVYRRLATCWLEPSNSFVTWFWILITMAARISSSPATRPQAWPTLPVRLYYLGCRSPPNCRIYIGTTAPGASSM